MTRLVCFLLSLPLLLVFTTSADAGPACARRNEGSDACIQRCKSKWGWPGHVMGSDRWGQVITKTVTNDMGAVVTKACRVRPSGLTSASTTSIASSTSPLLIPPPSSVPANAIISASVSTVTSSSSSASLRALTHTSSSTKKVTLAPLVASSTAPATTSSTSSSPKPTTSSTSSKPKPTTPTQTTTSHTEAPPPPETTTTKKTTTKQPAPTQSESGGQNNGGGNGNGNGNGDSNNNNNGNGSSNNDNNGSGNSGNSDSGNSGNNGGSSGNGATSQSDIDQYLQAHNSVRAQHGASPLTWSDDLAAKAQQWANNCVFEHSGGKLGPFGENLAAGTGNSYGIQSAVKSWTDEVSEYDPNNPQPSHFTQVVWKASTQVGCAVQSCNGIFDAKFGVSSSL
ncbi:hypothetical protein C8Q77DRAFT_53695 [Trametes polyzona]|nr:hypothetical protein C8Q77DRAFT_53695 [Trametes polyzona]